VFWPLSHVLLEAWGWRATFGIYAAMHLLVCLPIHLAIPRAALHAARPEAAPAPLRADRRLRALAVAFALGTFVFGVVAVHMINLLTAAGLTEAQAVTLSMLAGPLQVVGRILEMATARHFRAVSVGFVAFALMLAALAALGLASGMDVAAVGFIVAYGMGNGLLTVVKGTAPAELLGREALGAKLGYLARAGSYAKALAPAAYSGLLAAGLTRDAALAALALMGVGAIAALQAARRGEPAPQPATASR
jgi:predicted MFS family arabinose efflux permease